MPCQKCQDKDEHAPFCGFTQPTLRQRGFTRGTGAGVFPNPFARGFSDVELGALLVALKCKGESPQEIASSVRACLQESQALHCPFVVIDNCGTGGDGLKSFNISTISAFVCACLGVKMAKAGNYSSSGSGSAELLECLGFNIRLSPKQVSQSLDLGNFAFLFAPLFYPSFAKAAPLRKALKIRTLFNLLGPLLNPLRPKRNFWACLILSCVIFLRAPCKIWA